MLAARESSPAWACPTEADSKDPSLDAKLPLGAADARCTSATAAATISRAAAASADPRLPVRGSSRDGSRAGAVGCCCSTAPPSV